MNVRRLLLLAFFCLPLGLQAQNYFEVTALSGNARAERSDKKVWEGLDVANRVEPEDIVETFFQTRLVLEHASGAIIILGSNSKVMISVKDVELEGKKTKEFAVTVFGGGCFSKTGKNTRIKVFSANAVAEVDSGAVSAVVEEKSGETGFQILEGSASVRNIAQQKGKRLGAGQTTIIFPQKEPTIPLYITNRHVAVLKHFFGDEYIQNQLKSSGITPTDDVQRDTPSRTRISENILAKKEVKKKAAEGTYKRLFSADKIYGVIAEENARRARGVDRIPVPERLSPESKGEVGFRGGAMTAQDESFPFFLIFPRFSISLIDVGFRLALEKNYESFGMHQFGNVPGIFDLVEYFRVGVNLGDSPDSLKIEASALDNFTLGSGLVFDRFSSEAPSDIFQPLGLQARLSWKKLDVVGFVSDLSNFSLGGINAEFSPGNFSVGGGFYYDANQYYQSDFPEGRRFSFDDTTSIADSLEAPVYIYEFSFGTDFVDRYDARYGAGFGFAQKFLPNVTDGFAIRFPRIYGEFPKISFEVGALIEVGRYLAGQFHSFYPSNRWRIDSLGQIATQNLQLSKDRKTGAFYGSFEASPLDGLYLGISVRHDFVSIQPFERYDSTFSALNFDYRARIAVNDSLLPFVKHAEVYAQQLHGGLFPSNGTYGSSWGFETGASMLTTPLFLRMGLQGGFRMRFFDLSDADGKAIPNDQIDPMDRIMEFWGGVRWSIL